ncbi:MAG: hypothetical protein JWN67_4350 [Actinomycetia bacterium]|nr:hypothetical protein [Actinomycetes bacterium]
MRPVVPAAVVGVAVLAVAVGLVLDRDDPTPRTNGGWTPILVPRPEPRPEQPRVRPPTVDSTGPPSILLLPPATGPARIYPL